MTMTQNPQDDPVGTLALTFAQLSMLGNFEAARALLSAELQMRLQPSDLERAYHTMLAYTDSPPTAVELMNVDAMNGWKVRETTDLGFVYVAICGLGYSEAVSVVVAEEAGRTVIRSLEWGRP